MRFTLKQFIYFLNVLIVVFATVLIYYIYTQQKQNLVKIISAQIKSSLIQSGYIFSKILNNNDDTYVLKPYLDRQVATNDIIKGFMLTDGNKVLLKSGKTPQNLPEKSYMNIYEINENVLINNSVFCKKFSFFIKDRKKEYCLYLFTDRVYVHQLLQGLKMKFFVIWVFTLLIMFIVIELMVKRLLLKPMHYLEKFADKKTDILQTLPIRELEIIKNTLHKTFSELDKQIEHLYDITITDYLTGLKNRKYLYEYLNKKLKSNPEKFAVVLLDLDNFKEINDYYGHNVGDEVLIKVAEVLRDKIKVPNEAIRIGGDEFLLIVEIDGNEKNLLSFLEDVLESLNQRCSQDSKDIAITVSIGVALYPDNGNSIEELMKNADIALYEAKKRGKNKIVSFNEELKNKINKMLDLKNRFNKALENNEFVMYYQAKVDKNAEIVGCEALIRWFSKDGMISPAEFIPVAERSGFMVKLGSWIEEDVLKTRKEWDASDYMKDISIAFNVSVAQIRTEKFLSKFIEDLHRVQCRIDKLEVEITESVFVENKQTAKYIINEFHNLGLRVNLDDFGTGYSSLSFLQEFKVDILKVDKAFVDNVMSETGRVYIKTIVDMAKNLGLKTVAEGVETKEQFEILKSLGVDYFQGYYFAKPMPKKEFEEFVKTSVLNKS